MDCVVSFSLAALKCFARDRWIGLIPQVRNDRLCLIASNSRFPTLPCHHCPNPGSRILSGCRRPGNRQHLSCDVDHGAVPGLDPAMPLFHGAMLAAGRFPIDRHKVVQHGHLVLPTAVITQAARGWSCRPRLSGPTCPAPGKSPRWSPGAASWRRDGRPPKTGSRPRTSRLAAPGSRAGSACPAVAAAG